MENDWLDEILDEFYDDDDGTLGNRKKAKAKAKTALNAHFKKKWLGQLDDAIIYSAKHLGYWDKQVEENYKKGIATRIYLDIPSLKEALANMEGE